MRSEHDTQLGQAIAAMTHEHIECRDYGHQWAAWQAAELPRRRGFEQRLRCRRCRTVRHRILSRFGEILSSSYVYADGYLVDGLGRLDGTDRGQLRLASIAGTLNGTATVE